MTLKCPKCYTPIDPAEAARILGSRGGQKSRRTITPEQQKKMQEGRRKKKLNEALAGPEGFGGVSCCEEVPS